jgi:hypothetical protein
LEDFHSLETVAALMAAAVVVALVALTAAAVVVALVAVALGALVDLMASEVASAVDLEVAAADGDAFRCRRRFCD